MISLFLLLLLLPFGSAQIEQHSPLYSEDNSLILSSIKGRVEDSGELPLPGVQVILEPSGDGPNQTVVTDQDGNYHFDCVKGGKYSLVFRLNGFIPERLENFTYHSSHSFVVNRMLLIDPAVYGPDYLTVSKETTRALTIMVKDGKSSANIASARIKLSEDNGCLNGVFSTNACGAARVYLEPGRRYTVRISGNGFIEQSISLDMPEDARDLEIRLDPNK